MNIKDFTPLREYVLIRPHKLKEQRVGSVIIPGTRKADLLPGEVLKAGSGYISDCRKKHFPLEVKPGDKVLYSEWAGKEVQIEGETLLVMEEQDIQGVIQGEFDDVAPIATPQKEMFG